MGGRIEGEWLDRVADLLARPPTALPQAGLAGALNESVFLQIERVGAHAAVFPDGSVVREMSDPTVYVIFGGARFAVPDPSTLHRLYGGWGVVQVVADGSPAATGTVPSDGTILEEEHGPHVWRREAGAERHITSPVVLARFGGWSAVHTTSDGSLSMLPLGEPILT